MSTDLPKSPKEAHKRPLLQKDNPYVLVSFTYLLSLLFASTLGIRFDITPIEYFVQMLDMNLLENDLFTSVVYLHSQPPLYNLVTGLALKSGPFFSPLILVTLFYSLGYLAILSICDILLSLKTSKAIAVSVASIVAFSPQFIIYQNWYFYTHPVVALLLITACLFLRSKGEANRYFLAGSMTFATIIFIRSLYHPVLMLIALGLCLLIMKDKWQATKLFLIPATFVFFLCFKNALIFGFFGTSSWSGQNIHKATKQYVGNDIYLQEYEAGNLSEMTGIWEFSDGDLIMETMSLEQEYWGVDAVDNVYKSHQSANRINSNHWTYLQVSPVLLDDSLHLIKSHPMEYLQGVWKLGVPNFFLTKSIEPFFHDEEINAFPTYEGIMSGIETSKMILLIVFIGLVLNLYFLFKKNEYPEHRLFYLFSYSVIIYLIIVGLFGELGENYRFKYNAMWLVLCLAVAGWTDGVRWYRNTRLGSVA